MDMKRFTQEVLTKIVKQTDKRYAKDEDLDEVKKEIEKLGESSGEENTIEKIQVNGKTQEVVDKTVDITVPTKVSELTNDSGYQTSSDVVAAVAEIVADAPEDFDTLKEIADWIEKHADSAAEMNSAIKTNANDIEDLTELVGKLPEGAASKTVVEYIAEAISKIDLSGYLTEDDFSDMTDEEIAAAIAAADED